MEGLKGYIHYPNFNRLFIALLLNLPSLTTAQNDLFLYTLQEEQPSNTLIADISTDSGIKDEFSLEVIKQLKYSFLETPSNGRSGDESKQQYFKITESKGLLKTSKSIDRDKLCPKQPKCTFTLEIAISPAQYFRIITVRIDIIDLNDNKPKFVKSSVAVNVIESAQVNSVVALLPSGVDPDSGIFGISDYKLQTLKPNTHTRHSKRHSNVFSLQKKQGLDGSTELKLVLLKPLDRERVTFYQLQVTAYEGVVPPQSGTLLVNLTVLDTNDNPPVFFAESYSIDIPENTPVDSTITKVSAYDADIGANGHIVFGFTSRTKEFYGDMFGIDLENGQIYLKERLDYEIEATYQLVVTASDKGVDSLTSQVAVLVNVLDVNDYQPQITINSLSESGQPEVLEHAPKGTFITYVSVIDLDSGFNGEVTCILNTTHFQLSKMQNSRYTVVTDAIFDREIKDRYTVGLRCEDKGTLSLSSTLTFIVNILDVNDHPPIFKKSLYTANLEENNAPNVFLLQVNATDKDIGDNGLVSFGLSPGNSKALNSLFEIDANGVLRAKGILDHEQYETVTFEIIAVDQGRPVQTAKAQVSIEILDVNDCKPRFKVPAYSFGLYENELQGVNVGNVVAIDEDGEPYNKVSYRLEADNYHTLENFQINASNGLIKSKHSLDREKESSYYLKVVAFNPGFPGMSGTTSVTIYVSDDNDNNPIIGFPTVSNHTINVYDNTKPGFVFTRILAYDLDTGENSRLSYHLNQVNVGSKNDSERRGGLKINKDGVIVDALFNLDKRTGSLTVVEKLPMSYDISRYNLTIVVKDHGYPNNRKTTAFLTVICEPYSGPVLLIHNGDYEHSANNIEPAAQNKKRMPNLTIAIAVACGSTLVIVIIILLIVMLSYMGRKGRRVPQQQGQYNCRVEAQRMLNGNIGRTGPKTSPTHSREGIGPMSPDLQHTSFIPDDSGRGDSVSDMMPEPATGGQHRPSAPQTDRQHAGTPSNQCVVTLQNNDQFSTTLMPLTDHQTEIRERMKLLHSQQDHDTSHLDSLSTSDSGKGTSVIGELVSDNTNSMSRNMSVGSHSYSAAHIHNGNMLHSTTGYTSHGQKIPQPDAIHGYQIPYSKPGPGYNSLTSNTIDSKSLHNSADNPLYSVVNKPNKQVSFSTTLPKQSYANNPITTMRTQKSPLSTFSSLPRQTSLHNYNKVSDNEGFDSKMIKPLSMNYEFKEANFDDGDNYNLIHEDIKHHANINVHRNGNGKYGGIGVVRPMQNHVYPNSYNSSIKQPAGVNHDACPLVGSNQKQHSKTDVFPPPPPLYTHSDVSTVLVSSNRQLSDAESLSEKLDLMQDSIV